MSASSAKTKCHSLAGLKDRNLFFRSPGAEVQDQLVGRVAFFWGHSLWLHMASCLCVPTPGVSLCVQISSFYEDTGHIRLAPILRASFNLITSLKAPSPNSHILRSRGLGPQHMNFRVTTQPITTKDWPPLSTKSDSITDIHGKGDKDGDEAETN